MDCSEKFDFEPPVVLAWHSRPYAQPLLIEKLIIDCLSALRHVMVDRITQSLSHCMSFFATLDVAELSHDEEFESTSLKLRSLEGVLRAQKKLTAKVWTVARGTHSQAEIYEARVVDLESEITSRDATIVS